jgi:uncharacterized membrane protein YbhN (UPF0104 family)
MIRPVVAEEDRLQAGIESSSEGSARWGSAALVVLRVALFSIAVLAIRHALRGVSVGETVASLERFGWQRVSLSAGLTTASFLVLGVVELFALRYIGRRAERTIPRRTAITTAFIANAYSQSVGLALLTGAAVRIRSYSRYGLDNLEVARITAFVTITATLGLLTTGSAALLTWPDPFTSVAGTIPVRAIGALLAAMVVAYLGWAVFGTAAFHGRGRWRIRRPSWKVALAQIGISSLDWLLAATVLFVLLPRDMGLTYGGLVGVYFVAQSIAVLSHVPGGFGVFEALILALITSASRVDGSASFAAELAASVFLYRIVYYILPLFAAIAISGIVEMIRARTPTAAGNGPATAAARAAHRLASPDAV